MNYYANIDPRFLNLRQRYRRYKFRQQAFNFSHLKFREWYATWGIRGHA